MKLKLEPSPSHPHRSKDELIQFLRKEKRWFSWLCWHDWCYWTWGVATKTHRVCTNGYKKQKGDSPTMSSRWVKDNSYKKVTNM